MAFDIPILFIIFNRPDTTEKVFQEIRKQQPKYLFVAADGPRLNRPDDVEKCKETRAIVSQIDWDCELKLLLREENLGCGLAVSGAITWFFDQVEMGIVLEDDCLPHSDFFPFCKELLLQYQDMDQVKWISGNNCNIKSNKTDSSYYFSAYNHVWGWASWRRVWNEYHYDISEFNKRSIYKNINYYFHTLSERLFWKNRFQIISNEKVRKKRKINTWDYQSTFSIWMKNGVSIIPQSNLITNIGFGEDSTHTFNNKLQFQFKPILPILHNPVIKIDHEADRQFYKNIIYKPLWKYPLLGIKTWLEKRI